jgi:hypothetical protein
MRLILYLYFLRFLLPYMFRAFTGPSSGVSWAAAMLPFGSCRVCWLSVRLWRCVGQGHLHGRTDSQQKGHLHGRTDSQQTRQEPNGSIATAQDTPDDGPVRARNM